MTDIVFYTLKMDKKTAKDLDYLAEADEIKRSDALRRLIRREASRIRAAKLEQKNSHPKSWLPASNEKQG